MKKSFFSIVLCLVIWQCANAQISFAPSVGLNFSRTIVTRQPSLYGTPIQGYYAGILANCPLADSWAFQGTLQYSQKGQIWQFNKIKSRFNYIDFLPTIEYRVGKNKHLGISTGLNIGYDIFEQFKNPTDSNWENSKFKFMKPLDLGLLLGLKMYYEQLVFNLSYNQSFINGGPTYTNEAGEVQPTKTYNQNLQIGIGYFLVSTTKNKAK